MSRRVHVGQSQRRIDFERDGSVFIHVNIITKQLTPVRILQLDSFAVVVPVLPTLFAIHKVHVLVRGRVIIWHWGVIWIVSVEVATSRIEIDADVVRQLDRRHHGADLLEVHAAAAQRVRTRRKKKVAVAQGAGRQAADLAADAGDVAADDGDVAADDSDESDAMSEVSEEESEESEEESEDDDDAEARREAMRRRRQEASAAPRSHRPSRRSAPHAVRACEAPPR